MLPRYSISLAKLQLESFPMSEFFFSSETNKKIKTYKQEIKERSKINKSRLVKVTPPSDWGRRIYRTAWWKSVYCTWVLSPVLQWVLALPSAPLLLYQCVGLCVGVAALFEMSSWVQKRLLGGAELGGLGQLRALSVWERGRRARLPLGYWVPAGLGGLCGRRRRHARRPL